MTTALLRLRRAVPGALAAMLLAVGAMPAARMAAAAAATPAMAATSAASATSAARVTPTAANTPTAQVTPAAPAPGARLPKLTLAGPPATVSAPLLHMIETGALAQFAERIEFVAWRDPDQLRVLALDGKADVLAMPTNVAANLHNRGAPVMLLNVSTWGALWMVSRAADRRTLADFRGQEVAIPFRADMPDIVFQTLVAKDGLDPRKDFRLRYVPTPMEAMQLLITRRVDHALLSEPAASMALRKTKSFPIGLVAPELHRSVDLQQEWGRLFARPARIPQAGITAVGAVRARPDVIAAVEAAYARSMQWCTAHAQDCGALLARHVELVGADAIADSIALGRLEAVPAARARAELEFFFGQLLARDPAVIGGRLPPDAFYRSGQ